MVLFPKWPFRATHQNGHSEACPEQSEGPSEESAFKMRSLFWNTRFGLAGMPVPKKRVSRKFFVDFLIACEYTASVYVPKKPDTRRIEVPSRR